jgi:hypothetical protein
MTETDPSPPPVPPTDPPPNGSSQASVPTGSKAMDNYNRVTDKIAGPSLRVGDNLASLCGTVIGGLIGAGIGYLATAETLIVAPWLGAVLGGMAGAVIGLFLVGFVLMIIGLVRR